MNSSLKAPKQNRWKKLFCTFFTKERSRHGPCPSRQKTHVYRQWVNHHPKTSLRNRHQKSGPHCRHWFYSTVQSLLFPPFQPKPPFVLLGTCFPLGNNQLVSSLIDSHLPQAFFRLSELESWLVELKGRVLHLFSVHLRKGLCAWQSLWVAAASTPNLNKNYLTLRHLPKICATGTCLSMSLLLRPVGAVAWRQST